MGVPIMAVPTNVKRVPKERDYDNITITLENCILPSEKIDETPSMKDGLDRDTENDLRMFGCELIQTAGLLLKLPQVAMATGQVLLQRFYYSRSLVKHEVEVSAMAAIFLAAKIEESPRRIRDIINVYEHVKQTMLKKSQDSLEKLPRLIEVINKRPHTPMDYMSNHYYNLKNAIIKAERVILKVLGFCVHVKHPHKIIITYLQILEHEKNAALARKAWNYMNDSLRTDVFVRFSPEIIACACIFLAARSLKINLPMRPPWWELFDALYDDIEDIALSILRLYSKPRSKITRLEAQVNKIKKTLQEKKQQESKETESTNGSFTPSHNSTISGETQPAVLNNNNSSKPSSKKNSPAEKEAEKRPVLSSVISSSKRNNDRKRGSYKSNRNQGRSESDESSDDSSDSEAELPSKKYAQQRKQYERKKRSPSSDSGNDRRTIPSKISRSDSPVDRKNKSSKDVKSSSYKESNGHYKTSYTKQKRRSRSRSPVKRGRLASPNRKDKYLKEKSREKIRSKDKYVSSKIRR